MAKFENLTILGTNDLNDHVISIAVTECGHEERDVLRRARIYMLSGELRQMEDAKIYEGAISPILDAFRRRAEAAAAADVDDEYAGYYAIRAEVERLLAA